MAAKSTTTIEVEIFGQVYPVRGEHDREHLEALAAVVDRKMREVGERISTLDRGKIAILAALNLANELDQCSKQQEGERDRIMDKVAALTAELTDALHE
ncbi:MAG: cell division protein ZapA [Acidobacteria bacterium]|nr:MAG: cell division protein ZapA [Acidobacteriota bacterium]